MTGVAAAVALLSGPSHAQVQGALPAFVRLQNDTPGTAQTGHSNVTGTAIAGQFVGGGGGLTGLNASNLASGTVPTGRLTGAYSGITGLGTVTSGTWASTPIGPGFGGTGINTASTPAGSLLFTSAIGTWGTRAIGAAGTVLGSNGSFPNWVPDGVTLPHAQTVASVSDLINITQTGAGDCIQANITNPGSVTEAVEGRSDGGGDVFLGFMTGTGRTALFQTSNAANTNPCVQIVNNSTNSSLDVQASGAGMIARFHHTVGPVDVEVGGANGAVNTNGFVYREYTVSTRSAAIPVAYGSISSAGVVNGGTGNFTVTHTVTGDFDITIDGEVYSNNTFTASANVLQSNTPFVATLADAGTPLRVCVWNLATGVKADQAFHFVVWKASAAALEPGQERGPDHGGSGLPISGTRSPRP